MDLDSGSRLLILQVINVRYYRRKSGKRDRHISDKLLIFAQIAHHAQFISLNFRPNYSTLVYFFGWIFTVFELSSFDCIREHTVLVNTTVTLCALIPHVHYHLLVLDHPRGISGPFNRGGLALIHRVHTRLL